MKKLLLMSGMALSLLFGEASTDLPPMGNSYSNVVNQNYIDNLPKGWSLIGIEHNVKNLNDFRNSDIIYTFDKNSKNWKVYSPMSDIQEDIKKSPYNGQILTSIPAGSGIWVYRKIDLPKFQLFNYKILQKTDNTAKVELKLNISLPNANELFYKNTYFDNEKEINLTFSPSMDKNYSTADINLTANTTHKITICEGVGFINSPTSKIRYNVCKTISISTDNESSTNENENNANSDIPDFQ